MNMEYQGGEHHPEKLDADAVCIQCGTVNVEGTLLCKVCGNNLRDQRARRMNTDQALELDHTGPRNRAWASAVLFILAVGLVFSTIYNKEMIVEWMMDVGVSDEKGPSSLWRGDYSGRIDDLLVELRANLPTEEVAFIAQENVVGAPTIDGIYVLFFEGEFVGSANVFFDGEELLVAALLESGEEIRGRATSQGNYYIMVPEKGGMETRNRIISIQGVASPQSPGIVECVGDEGRTRYSCMAYQLAS